MPFVFASSHLPEDNRPEEEEEEDDDVQPMQRSGMVRAFSHLPQPVRAAPADPSGPISQRDAQPLGRQLQPVRPEGLSTPREGGVAAAKASGLFGIIRQHFNEGNDEHFMDEDGNIHPHTETRLLTSPSPHVPRSPKIEAGPPPRPYALESHTDAGPGFDAAASPGMPTAMHAPEDTRPWHLPHITPEDLHSQGSAAEDHDAEPIHPGSAPRVRGLPLASAPGLIGRVPQKWNPAPDTAPGAQTPPEKLGIDPGMRPGSVTPAEKPGLDQNTTEEEATVPRSSSQPYGRLFEKRPTPGFTAPKDRPEYNDLVYRTQGGSPPKPEFSDLVYRFKGSPEKARENTRGFFQNVADTRDVRLSQSSPPSRPANTTPPAPQSTTQGSKPGAQVPAAKPAPVKGAAPQKPAANGQTPQPQLSPEDREELFDKDGNERKPIGQLGIKGGTGFGKGKNGRPKTVCLYDGKDTHAGKGEANATSLLRAANEYATNPDWVIDISLPHWEDKLRAIQRITEGEGTANDPLNGIDRIMVFDHGGAASQEFGSSLNPATKQWTGNYLTPTSPAWQVITSSIKPQGDIVLTGCKTAKQEWNNRNPLTNEEGRYLAYDGEKYLQDMFYAANGRRSPTIHAYDEDVRHRTFLNRPSLTAGRQHSFSFEGHKITK